MTLCVECTKVEQAEDDYLCKLCRDVLEGNAYCRECDERFDADGNDFCLTCRQMLTCDYCKTRYHKPKNKRRFAGLCFDCAVTAAGSVPWLDPDITKLRHFVGRCDNCESVIDYYEEEQLFEHDTYN